MLRLLLVTPPAIPVFAVVNAMHDVGGRAIIMASQPTHPSRKQVGYHAYGLLSLSF